jgi:hypothetical protein
MKMTVMATVLLAGLVGVTTVAAKPISKDVLVDLTNEKVEVIEELKETKTYYEIAEEYDVLDEYKEQVLTAKKARIAEKVADGMITQEQADEIIKNIGECDGTPNPMRLGQNYNQNRKGQ